MREWNKKLLQEIVGGSWYYEPGDDWGIYDFVIDLASISKSAEIFSELKPARKNKTMFIAMDKNTFLKGSGNTGVYGDWEDTHPKVRHQVKNLEGVITQHLLTDLPSDFPQLIVENTYEAMLKLAAYASERMEGRVIGVTGTAGKSSTCAMLSLLLKDEMNTYFTRGNHNTRTGISLHLAGSYWNPELLILEVAISALWMKSRSISEEIHPDIAIITSIGLGQVNEMIQSEHDTAIYKSKICEGIKPGGMAVLNHEMHEYQTVLEEVKSMGASPISYGFGDDCEARILSLKTSPLGSDIELLFQGELVRYRLPVVGKAMALNSAAALVSAKLLGIPMNSLANKLLKYPTLKSVLEFRKIPIGSGDLLMLDDSYNSEIISMIEALQISGEIQVEGKGAKIAILGRIVNLGIHSDQLHLQLLPYIQAAKLDLVYFYGQEMELLAKTLPKRIVGGLFTNASECVNALTAMLKEDDFLLIKGSRRASDFGSIANRIETYYHQMNRLGEKKREIKQDEGLGNVILLHLLFTQLEKAKIRLSDVVQGGSWAITEKKLDKAFGLEEGETIDVYTALQSFLLQGSADTAIALSDLLAKVTKEKTSIAMEKLRKEINLSENSVRNITGRKRSSYPQSYSEEEVLAVVDLIYSHTDASLSLLRNPRGFWKKQLHESDSELLREGLIHSGYFFGDKRKNAFGAIYEKGRYVKACVLDAPTDFARDYTLSKKLLLQKQHLIEEFYYINFQQRKEIVITIGGDLYFGEFYSEERRKREISDPLQTGDYLHSAKKLIPFLHEADFNLANLECVLTTEEKSPYQGISPYILRARPTETVDTLRKMNIHALTLATNHCMDYSDLGIYQTIEALEIDKFSFIGAGRNLLEARKALCIKLQERNLYIFNFYQFKEFRYRNTRSYALGERPGTICEQGEIFEQIRHCKEMDPLAYVLVIPHWGTDYVMPGKVQEDLATQLIDSGADLILGHGPHCISGIKKIHQKFVQFSLGNFIFNSNGEFAKRHIPSLGFLARLRISAEKLVLRFYLLEADNNRTYWQPDFIGDEVIEVYRNYLTLLYRDTGFVLQKDNYGYYLEKTIS
ncbi:MAG: CapA family protein [Vallitaleaceae bacterium]|nr:CapA family protein [Vallitaleaceae bacterium]